MAGPVVVVAVDWGATTIRVCRVDLAVVPPQIEVVHRHAHQPVGADADRRWDWDRLLAETRRGIELAIESGPVASIGVDTWGVDYGVLDDHGDLLSPPHSYRSTRTDPVIDGVLALIGERALYERTGIQLQPFNTIFQLAAHDRDELGRARHALLLPDLIVHALTGNIGAERTAAGTTGLLDVRTREWAIDVAATIGLPDTLLPPLVEPATPAGTFLGVPVHRIGGHDTASAVVAMGRSNRDVAYIATGTWLLVGREQAEPDTSVAAQLANLTNEQGVDGGIRLLKNVAGFWILNECCRQWGIGDPAAVLVEAATVADDAWRTFDATDDSLLHPTDMATTVTALAGLAPDAPAPVVARSIVESLATTARQVFDVLPGTVGTVNLIGGGAGVTLLRKALQREGLNVHVGPTEAAALGNALVQGIALGLFTDVADARTALRC